MPMCTSIPASSHYSFLGKIVPLIAFNTPTFRQILAQECRHSKKLLRLAATQTSTNAFRMRRGALPWQDPHVLPHTAAGSEDLAGNTLVVAEGFPQQASVRLEVRHIGAK